MYNDNHRSKVARPTRHGMDASSQLAPPEQPGTEDLPGGHPSRVAVPGGRLPCLHGLLPAPRLRRRPLLLCLPSHLRRGVPQLLRSRRLLHLQMLLHDRFVVNDTITRVSIRRRVFAEERKRNRTHVDLLELGLHLRGLGLLPGVDVGEPPRRPARAAEANKGEEITQHEMQQTVEAKDTA
jgi:hypothetical protein